MLLLGVEIPVWLILLTVSLLLLYWYGTATHGIFKKMGVPYATPLPFFGQMFQQFLMPLHEYDLSLSAKFPGKIYGNFQGRTPMLDVSDIDIIKQITVKEFSSFTNHRDVLQEDTVVTQNIAGLKDDHWKHVRSTITPTFTSGKLKQMYPVINDCADKCVAHLRTTKSEPAVIKDYMEGFTMDVIASTAFGLDIDTQSVINHPFVANAKTFFGVPNKRSKFMNTFVLFSLFLMPKPIRDFLGLFMDMSFVETDTLEYFNEIISKTLAQTQEQMSKRKDFISMCSDKIVDIDTIDKDSLRTTNGRTWTTKGLTKGDVFGNALIFLTAGFDTTASTLRFFFYNMTIHPDIQEKLHQMIAEAVNDEGEISYEEINKLEYLDWCINETLRMYPPASRMDRVANRDVQIAGITIPKGMVVNLLIYTVHRDPEYWVEPDKFNPDRFAPENQTEIQQHAFMPFGTGNRSCIAMRLARLELRVAIVKLLLAFRFEKTAEVPEEGKMKYSAGFGLLRPATPLKLCAIPRDS